MPIDDIYYQEDYKGGTLSVVRAERNLIVKTLNRTKNRLQAYGKLGISEKNLYLKIKNHRITQNDEGQYFSENKHF